MKKIFLYSRDPGAANCIVPVYKQIKKSGLNDADLFGKDFALDKYRKENLPFFDLSKILIEISEESVSKLLISKKYDIIVTGVGSNDLTDRLIWLAAKRNGIPTVAILDQWLNYKMRFTSNFLGEEDTGQKLILPDKICVMDEFAMKEMIAEGFTPEKLVVTGQPYFDTVSLLNNNLNNKEKIYFRKKYNIGEKDRVIIFASEPITETYKDSNYWGYTQFTILDEIIYSLNDIAKNSKDNFVLLIKLHPRNKKKEISNFILKYNLVKNFRLFIIDEVNTQLVIFVSDLVLGMSSMFLIEAAIVGKKFFSVQIGLKREDPFVLSRVGISTTIKSLSELNYKFNNFFEGNEDAPPKFFKIISDATENVIKLINKILYEK